jgi:TrmH family RNA methyltransferase
MISKNQIKEIQSLHLKKQRDEKRLFIVEGLKNIIEIVTRKPECIFEILATDEFLKNHGAVLNIGNIKYQPISEDDLKKISLQNSPNQVLAVCNYFEQHTETKIGKTGVSFFLDDIRDPGNFGTIIRLAAWFGISRVYCSHESCDLYNPKVIQSTMGAFLHVHVVYTTLHKLASENPSINIYGAVLDGQNIYDEKLQEGIIVIGNEANGICDENLKLLTHKITIPSAGNPGAESLNAAMAASILASEFFRNQKTT